MGTLTQFKIEVEKLQTGYFVYINDKIAGTIPFSDERQMAADAHDFLMEIDDFSKLGPIEGHGLELLQELAKHHTIH